MRALLLSRRLNSRLPKLPRTLKLESDLQQKGCLPQLPLLLCHRQDRGEQWRDTSMTLGTTLENAVNAPVRNTFQVQSANIYHSQDGVDKQGGLVRLRRRAVQENEVRLNLIGGIRPSYKKRGNAIAF